MPFRLGKSEKLPENEGAAAPEETPAGNEDAPSAEPGEQVKQGGHPIATSPAGDSQTEGSAPYRPEAFRPAFLDDGPSGEGAPTAAPAAEIPEGDAFFVSVTEDGNSQVHRFDDPSTAGAFVEELLEKGVAQKHVAAFSGRKLALKVTRRPIVKLAAGQED